MGTSFVLFASSAYAGRFSGKPAPEKMMSIPSSIAVLASSAKLDRATMMFTPKDPVRLFPGKTDLFPQCPKVGLYEIRGEIGLRHADAGGGYDADSALIGDGGGKA